MLVLPVLALAQTSRVEGMAIQGDYIKDYTGIYTYVSEVSNVGNLIYGELGNLTTAAGAPFDRSVGAVLGNLWDGNYGTWAIHMRQFTPNLGQGDFTSNPAPGALGFDPNLHANESFDLMWGRKFGTTSLGLRLNRSYVRFDGALGSLAPGFGPLTDLKYDVSVAGTSAAAANLARNIMGFGGGLGFEVNPNTNAEIALLWQSRTFEHVDSTGVKNEDDGANTYEVAARAMWQWQPNVVVIPVVKFYSYDLSTRSVAVGGSATATDNSLRGWQAGLSGDWTLGTNDLFILGLTFAQNRVDQETPLFGVPVPGFGPLTNGKITETFAPQIFSALETHVNSWLTLRFGANKGAYRQVKIEDRINGKTATVTNAPFSMSLGAGVKLGTLQLDAVLNDSFPQTLGGFFSQSTDYVSFAKVTATYPF
jgi:hypothetical protein